MPRSVGVPTIGRSLLGDAGYERLAARLRPGQQAILVAGEGVYSFKGSGYVRGGIFDRIELLQDGRTLRFRDRNHTRLGDIAAAGAPRLPEIGLFVVPPEFTLDPMEPWQLQLLVQRATGARDKAFLTFELGYRLPDQYLGASTAVRPRQPQPPRRRPRRRLRPPGPAAATGEDEPLWSASGGPRPVTIGITAVALMILTGIFFFQDQLVRRPRAVPLGAARLPALDAGLARLVRQRAALDRQRPDLHQLPADRLQLGLLPHRAADLRPLVRRRGGADLLGPRRLLRLALPLRRAAGAAGDAGTGLKVPQVTMPWGLHERLWPIKYIIFLGLLGLSLHSMAMAEQLAEVEPFKTAIILKFIRDWPFTLYAVALLVAGLFVERFFCRYLCPLGAALAIPGRMRTFEWLKRWSECGSPCQRCAASARSSRSTPRATSIRTSASTACTARSCTAPRTAARTTSSGG